MATVDGIPGTGRVIDRTITGPAVPRLPATAPAAPARTSGLAIASLVLGILGFCSFGLTALFALYFDGTWNKQRDRTNVFRLFQLTVSQRSFRGSFSPFRLKLSEEPQAQSSESDQIKYYHRGIGVHWGEKILGGAFGFGLSRNIKEGYLWLAQHYQPGDDVFVFGFSRGAYTQSFFTRLLEKKALGSVDPSKGKFRSFLLASLQNFLNNEWDKARRLKRGGAVEVFSFDAEPAEERYQFEPFHDESPEKVFERRWAQAVLEQVVARLQEEFTTAKQTQRFEVLKDFLMGDPRNVSYDDAAKRLGLSVSAVTSAIHRMRLRFRDLFRAEITNTVASPDEVDEEIRYLLIASSE